MAKSKRAAAKKKPIKLPRGLLGQPFLILVACFVLTILSFGNVHGNKPAPDNVKSTRLSLRHTVKPPVTPPKSLPTPPPQPAAPILPWRGPVQPTALSPAPLPPVFTTIPTTEPVVFITIDDGWVQTPENLRWLTAHHLPLSIFLTDNGIKNDYQYFQKLQNAGMTVEDHTISHPHFSKLNLDQQRSEICAAADVYQNVFHHRPTLLRPPYGEYNDITRQAAMDCGMKALIMWRAVAQNGQILYQDNNTHLNPGDIVLTHFEPDLIANLQALTQELDRDHLQVGHLEDWLQ